MEAALERAEIQEVLNRHQIYIDLQDAEGYASLYSADGRYDSPFGNTRGRSALTEMFMKLKESGFTANKRHMSGPAMIDISGDKATALSYSWVAEIGVSTTVYAVGTYRDELAKISGRWQIISRIQTVDCRPVGRRSLAVPTVSLSAQGHAPSGAGPFTWSGCGTRRSLRGHGRLSSVLGRRVEAERPISAKEVDYKMVRY